MKNNYRLAPLAMLLSLVVWTLVSCKKSEPEPTTTETIEVEIVFSALWWSVDQMEGLNVSNAPPKQSRINLAKWEASDPVGTPHPKSFDVIAIINTPASAPQASIALKRRLGIGGLFKSEPLSWTEWKAVGKPKSIKLAVNAENKILLGTIQIDKIQELLYQKKQWPWVFEAEVELTITSDDGDKKTKHLKQLEIQAGD